MSVDGRRGEARRLLAIGTLGVAAALVLAVVEPVHFLPVTVVVGLLAVGLAMPIPVPWGGSVPVGYALVVPLAVSDLEPDVQVVAGALAVAIAVVVARADRTGVGTARFAVRSTAAVAAAIGASAAVVDVSPGVDTVGRALAVAAGLVVVDALIAGTVPAPDRIEVKSAVPVYLAVASAATLVAVTAEQLGPLMAGVPLLPLLLARFSFQRYATANATLEQTVLALGFVPELVGLASVGQSERVALYADRMAESLGFDRRHRQRIVIASRLHRLGAVQLDEDEPFPSPTSRPDDPASLAAEGARILRGSGFPDEISDLVEQARAGSLEGSPPTLEASVIRVAVAFDAVVADDPARARLGLARVGEGITDRSSRRTVAALHQLVNRGTDLVDDAVAAGARFRDATDDLDLERLFAAGRGVETPASRRRPTVRRALATHRGRHVR